MLELVKGGGERKSNRPQVTAESGDFTDLSAQRVIPSADFAQEEKRLREVLRDASRANTEGDVHMRDAVDSGRSYRKAARLHQSVIDEALTLYGVRENPLTCEALCGLGVMQYNQGCMTAPFLYHGDARDNLVEASTMASRLGKKMAFTGARAEAHLKMLERS